MSIFLDVMKEELERNLLKQKAFFEELESLPKGYLSICIIGGKKYVYRKRRDKSKILSEYIGVPGDENCKKAEEDRKQYLLLERSLKELKSEEKRLRKAIEKYEKLWKRNDWCFGSIG